MFNLMLRTFKYRIYPSVEQKVQMRSIFGAVRFVYNLGLETKIAAYTSAKVNLSCFDLNKQITQLKKFECPWLSIAPAQALQQSMSNLDNAYTNFFRGAGFPKFKKKSSRQCFSLPQGVKFNFDDSKIYLPKLGWLSIVIDRQFKGLVKTVTVSKTATDKYFVSVLVDTGTDLPQKPLIDPSSCVGIDLGVKDLAILSDGTKHANHKFLKQMENRLAIEQRTLSRRFKRGRKAEEQSSGYRKQRLVVAKIYEKIANQRKDNLHKVTSSIVKNWNTIIIEDLNVQGLIDKNASSMKKAIYDASLCEFRRQLVYKSEWYCKNLLFIGRFEPSSKTCSNCGKMNRTLKLGDREWTCSGCGSNHDRDVNAAINIKNFGLHNKNFKQTGFRIEPLDAKVAQ